MKREEESEEDREEDREEERGEEGRRGRREEERVIEKKREGNKREGERGWVWKIDKNWRKERKRQIRRVADREEEERRGSTSVSYMPCHVNQIFPSLGTVVSHMPFISAIFQLGYRIIHMCYHQINSRVIVNYSPET